MRTLKSEQGFTLMEVMIATVITGILAAALISSYLDQVRKSRRMDAVQTILSIQLAQESYRTNNLTYGSLANVWNGTTTTQNGLYTLSITNTSSTSYTISATATGSQSSDKQNGITCSPMKLVVDRGNETQTPAACWIN